MEYPFETKSSTVPPNESKSINCCKCPEVFYVEDASGNLVQKECAGTESKSETEKLLRQAMEDYENKKFIFLRM